MAGGARTEKIICLTFPHKGGIMCRVHTEESMFPDVKFLGMTLYEWCLVLGVLAALVVARVYADRLKLSAKLQNCGILSAAVAILSGYGFAVLFQAVYDWIASGKFVLNAQTGATFYGGLIGGAAVFFLLYFCVVCKLCGKEAKEAFPKVLGIGACSIAAAHTVGRIGCFMAGCCYGAETELWIGIFEPGAGVNGARVIPTQLLEAIFLFELFLLLTYVLFRTKANGIALYMLLYGIFRFFNEYLRQDDRGSFLPGLSPSQAWSVVLAAAGAALLLVDFLRKKRRASGAD